jgi:heme exporter protein C
MLWPLLVLAVAFQIYYLATMLARARAEIIRREGRAQWVRDRAADRPPGGSAPEGEEGA